MRKFAPSVSYDPSLYPSEITALKPFENMLTTRVASATSDCSEDNRWHAVGEGAERRITFVRYPAKTAAVRCSIGELAKINHDSDILFTDLLFRKGVANIVPVVNEDLERQFGKFVKIKTSTAVLTGTLLGYAKNTRIESIELLIAGERFPRTVSLRQILVIDHA